MSRLNIIRAWKDQEYRVHLNDADLGSLPAHPAGLIDLVDAELDAVTGGMMCNSCGCTILTPQGKCGDGGTP